MAAAGVKRPYEALESGLPTAGAENQQLTTRPSKKVGNVSRKVTACTECQKAKIKCDLSREKAICGRCERKGLQCVVSKSLQTLLEEESQWRTAMEESSRMVQSAVSEILRTLDLPALDFFGQHHVEGDSAHGIGGDQGSRCATAVAPTDAVPGNCQPSKAVKFLSELASPNDASSARRQNQASGMAMTRENSQEPDSNNMDSALFTAPMGTLYEVTKLRNLRSNPHDKSYRQTTSMEDDFISQGRLGIQDAEHLFEHFSKFLNAYLWGGIALVHADLTSVRRSSSLLLAAILTVSALHIPGMEKVFDVCYAEFVSLVCESMLDRYHTLDGIRGLCIGAFWLSDLSWKLSGHAVRIATELNLHQSYSRALAGSLEHFEAARLWYFLYVCDHHFSIAYGRPPVIHEDATILHHEKFLQLPQTTQADHRLHSQVAVFIILTEIYNTFGPDIEQTLTEHDLIRVRNLNLRLDQWRADWEERLAPNPYIGSYPSKGVGLHYQYAKLQLNSLSLRGFQHPHKHELSTDRREFATIAISCAQKILRITLEEPDIRHALVGVPLYLHTMITYATLFLLKVHRKWTGAQLGTDLVQIEDLVRRIITLLREAKASERHLTYQIATGLSKMLDRSSAWEKLRSTSQVVGSYPEPNQAYQVSDMSYEIGADYGPWGMYTDPMAAEQAFPIGFFDALSSAMLE